jgi:hypothetical protein
MKKWQKAEKKDAKLFGARNQRGSGRDDHYPSDAVSDDFAIETKHTDKASYSVSLERWFKLVEESATLNQKDNKNRAPLMSLHIRDQHLVVLSYADFQLYMKRLGEAEEKAWKYDECST